MSSKTLLVLAVGPLQLPAVNTALRMGLRVVAADGNPAAPGMALAHAAHCVDIRQVDACLEVARRERVDGVIQICSEVSILPMGRINEELGLSGIDAATAVRATNKEAMRHALSAAGAPCPAFFVARSEQEAAAAAGRTGFPLIVKPSRNSGSRGITRLDHQDPAALAAALAYALDESQDDAALVEEFVDGPEFSVEILTWGGRSRVLAVTDKLTSGAPHYVEMGHNEPSRVSAADQQAVARACVDGVAALGIDWAASHAEARLGPHGPVIMEIGPRMGGDFITTELVPRSTGIDMVEGAINLALGREPDLSPRREPAAAAIRYLAAEPGRVTSVQGEAAARAMPGVKIVDLYYRRGEVLPVVKSSLTRHGHVIAEGADPDQAIARAEAARDAIRIGTEP